MKNLILTLLSLLMCFFSLGQSCSRVCNSDFEDNILTTPGNLAFATNLDLDCWNTTATDGMMEVWSNGCEGVPSYSGQQFIELNAFMVSTLYQDISVVPGETFSISFAHRGRWGIDVLSLSIGPIGGPYINIGNFTADSTAWIFNSLNYTFPNNAVTNYRLQFNSVSSSGGMPSVGNFLDAISVTSANVLTLNLQASDIICNPDLTMGSINASVNGSIGNLTYTWSPNVSSSNSASNLVAGTYNVIVVDSIGCSDTAQVSITGAIPTINVSADISGCLGTLAQFSATGNGTISWNNGIQNGVEFIPEVGTSEYIATVSLPNGCQLSDTTKTIIFPNPIPNFIVNTTEGCESLSLIFTNLTSNTQSCFWEFGNGENSSSIDAVNMTYVYNGTYTVSLTLTDQNGCEGKTEIPNYIQVFPKPIASFLTSDDYFGFEISEIKFENTSEDASIFSWFFGDEGSSTQENPSYNFSNFTKNTDVKLVVSNQYGCIDSTFTTLLYKSINPFYVPNSFTPDGNKFNNTFSAVFPDDFKPVSYQFRIFNRWGNIIFESFDYQSSWDGKSKNEIVQEGTYTWEIIFVDSDFQKHNLNGHLSLLK